MHPSSVFSFYDPCDSYALASMPACFFGAMHSTPFLFLTSLAYVHLLPFPFALENSADLLAWIQSIQQSFVCSYHQRDNSC